MKLRIWIFAAFRSTCLLMKHRHRLHNWLLNHKFTARTAPSVSSDEWRLNVVFFFLFGVRRGDAFRIFAPHTFSLRFYTRHSASSIYKGLKQVRACVINLISVISIVQRQWQQQSQERHCYRKINTLRHSAIWQHHNPYIFFFLGFLSNGTHSERGRKKYENTE